KVWRAGCHAHTEVTNLSGRQIAGPERQKWADPGCDAPGPSGVREKGQACPPFHLSVYVYRPEERDSDELRVTLPRQEIENVADPIVVPALPLETQRLDEVLAGL